MNVYRKYITASLSFFLSLSLSLYGILMVVLCLYLRQKKKSFEKKTYNYETDVVFKRKALFEIKKERDQVDWFTSQTGIVKVKTERVSIFDNESDWSRSQREHILWKSKRSVGLLLTMKAIDHTDSVNTYNMKVKKFGSFFEIWPRYKQWKGKDSFIQRAYWLIDSW